MHPAEPARGRFLALLSPGCAGAEFAHQNTQVPLLGHFCAGHTHPSTCLWPVWPPECGALPQVWQSSPVTQRFLPHWHFFLLCDFFYYFFFFYTLQPRGAVLARAAQVTQRGLEVQPQVWAGGFSLRYTAPNNAFKHTQSLSVLGCFLS